MDQPPPFAASIVVAVPPEQLYALVSDVTRTGEWSPICAACWWDEGAGPRGRRLVHRPQRDPGAHLGDPQPGRRRRPGPRVRLAGRRQPGALELPLEPVEGGTRLTEAWEFLPAGLALFAQRYGDDAAAQVAERTEAAHRGIP